MVAPLIDRNPRAETTLGRAVADRNTTSAVLRQSRSSAPVRTTLFSETLRTPIGLMIMLTDEGGTLRAVDWMDHEERMHRLLRRQYPRSVLVLSARKTNSTIRGVMERYFEGDLDGIKALAARTGGTVFQNRVWQALRQIPVGRTISYGALASQLGTPSASRAVGLANGANPIGIVLPCHRVIGVGGGLTGYGGGLERKRWLLRHEGAI